MSARIFKCDLKALNGPDFSFQKAYRQLCKECNFYAVGTMRTPLVVDPTAECGWQFAKMGKGVETVLDLSARNTLVAANPPKIDIAEMPEMLESLRQQVLPWLEPGLLRADLHSVLMYNEGSFFKSHRDAPKAASHLLTLSVEAQPRYSAKNKEFKGGHLVFTRNVAAKKGEHPDWRKQRFEVEERGVGSWNAWFNSTYHEITPLTAGSSIRAIFNVSLNCPLGSARASKFHRVEGSGWTEAVDVIASHLEDDMEGSFLFLDQYLGSPKDEQPLAFFSPLNSTLSADNLHPVQLIGADRLFFEAAKQRYRSSARIRSVRIYHESDIWGQPDVVETQGEDVHLPFQNLEGDDLELPDVMEKVSEYDKVVEQGYMGNDGGIYTKFWARFAVDFHRRRKSQK